jgi:TonB-linked SusC/RagA family outer membrane protein
MNSFIKVTLLSGLLFLSNNAFGQEKIHIKGKVTAASDPLGLPGVTVVELDKNNRVVSGTTTNIDGDYAIDIRSSDNKLQFSFIGFKEYIVEIKGQQVINVKLEEQVHEIKGVEIVAERRTNIGIFDIADRNLAIPVSKINAKDFEDVQATSIDDALQGRLAGVDIAANSGDPGAGMSIRIRGVSTLSANNKPLIVVDNIPYETNIAEDFNFGTANEEGYAQMLNISVDDIKEITVLKDAAATALWGTKAANGVLLITTKRGLKGKKPSFTYTYRGTYTFNPRTIPLLNGDEYVTMIKDAYYNTTGLPFPGDEYKELLGLRTEPYYYYNYVQNTDWMSLITRDGYIHNHDFSLDGGGTKAFYRFSVNYQDQLGTTIGTDFSRLTTRLNLDYSISDKLKIRTDLAYTHGDVNSNYSDDNVKSSRGTDVRSIAYKKMPNMSPYEYDAFGNLTGLFLSPESNAQGTFPNSYNPLALALVGKNKTINDRITTGFHLFYDIITGLRYTLDLSFDVNTNKNNKFLPSQATGRVGEDILVNQAYGRDDDAYIIFTNNKVSYSKKFNDKHDLMLTANVQTNEILGQGLAITSSKSASSVLQYPINESQLLDREVVLPLGRTVGLTTMANYILLDRYIFAAGLRREGNSRFDKTNRWGLFKSISAAWRISGEPFMKNLTFIDDWRLRFSYGENGNPPRKEGLFFSNYNTFSWGYLNNSAVYPTNMELRNLKWESIYTTNIGFSAELFKGRLSTDFDFYRNRTTDMFPSSDAGVPIQTTTGYASSYFNLGTMDNNGWDFSFKSVPFKKQNWSLTFDFNIARNYNILREVAENFPLERNKTISNGAYQNIIQKNNPIGSFYGYRYKGVYLKEDDLIAKDGNGNIITNPNGTPIKMVYDFEKTNYEFQLGDAMYEDINHDGQINAADIVYLGDANPIFFGGFGQMFTYKNFSINYYCYFRYGNDIINKTQMNGENMYGLDNQTRAVLKRWRKEGDITNIPRALMGYGYNWMGSDRFVDDGSFMRVKYITISYRLPVTFVQKFGIKSMRISSTVNNLFTFTKYKGQDPEININTKDGTIYTVGYDVSSTPRAKEITFNLSLNF